MSFSSLARSLGVLLCTAATLLAGVPASDTILPESVRGFVSIPDINKLSVAFRETQLGHLLNDPVMKPFGDDLWAQIQRKWQESHQPLGLSLEDVKGIAGGELAIALVDVASRPSLVLLLDVTGHEDRATTLLNKVGVNLVKRGAKQIDAQIAGAKVTLYDLPPIGEDTERRQAIYYLQDGLLGIFSDKGAAGDILERRAGKKGTPLAAVAAYKAVLERTANAAEEIPSHVRWYIAPLPFAESFRAFIGENQRAGTSEDRIRLLKNQGFEAVQGVGGHATLAAGPYGLMHRTLVYAPKPYELAMRMLDFPAGIDFAPPAWVPRELASYTAFQWDMTNAFERFATLFDEIYGETGVFEDMIESVATDPNGPKINIRTDLIAHLGTRGVLVTDYKLPLATTSQRRIFAAEATNPEALAAAIDRSMKGDPAVTRREWNGHVIYEITTEEADPVPELHVQHAHAPGVVGDLLEEEERLLPNSAVTVAKGMLFVSTHVDLLEKVLEDRESQDTLGEDIEYQVVLDQLKRIAGNENCGFSFLRVDEQFRLTYEMFRQGKLPETTTPFAILLNTLLGGPEEGVIRKPEIDASKLPEYQIVSRYLGPSGTVVSNQDDGWLFVGFSMSKESPLTADIRTHKKTAK